MSSTYLLKGLVCLAAIKWTEADCSCKETKSCLIKSQGHKTVYLYIYFVVVIDQAQSYKQLY